jgi:hypothetical protein
MNERIQQLAERALQLVADEHTGGDESRLNTDSYHVKDLIQAKFAELIIRECAMLVEGFTIEQEVALDDYQEYEASAVLKEHFGVEE